MTEIIDRKDVKKVLLKNNNLVSARYNLSTNECRVFNHMLYKIQMNKNINGEKFCIVSQDEFRNIIKNRNITTIPGIIQLLNSLKKNDIYLKEKKLNTSNNYIWAVYSFISGYEFDDEFNTFKITCADKVFKTLTQHDYKKEGFYTPINMSVWMQFKLSSTQRLYELLRLWSNSKSVITYRIIDIREFLMLENKYPAYKDFKKRILIPAINELNELGYFSIKIKEYRTNRNVTSIDFIVKDLDGRSVKGVELDINNNSTITFLTDTLKQSTQGHSDECIDVEYVETTEVDSDMDNVKQSNKGVSITNGGVNMTYGKSDNKNDDFYVPNTKLFTAKTLNNFKNDFNDYDFRDTKNKEILFKSIMLTLEKDDEDKIKVKSYQYFKTTLNDQLGKINEVKVFIPSVKTRHHNINQTFTKYNDDELEQLLFERQKEKGMLK